VYQQQQLLSQNPQPQQQKHRDRQSGSSGGGTSGNGSGVNIPAGMFLSKVKDRIVEKIFQTSTEGPQLAAVVQERR